MTDLMLPRNTYRSTVLKVRKQEILKKENSSQRLIDTTAKVGYFSRSHR